MAVRRVLQIGDPRLKNKNKDVVDFNDKKLASLISDLKDTMVKTGLVGIAAPQIGKNYCVFATHSRNTKTRSAGKEDVLRIYINPKIIHSSKEEIIIYEGCGSVIRGQLFGPVKRPQEITVCAFDEKGHKFELTTNGLLARVIQHEYDHMCGIEFTEKIADYMKLVSRSFYLKNIKDTPETKELLAVTKIEYKNTP